MTSKSYIALFLLLLISFKTLIVPVIYVDFELRKAYIIQNLCENRFKPELHCDGKCYLAKTLTKIAEEKAQNAAQKQGDGIKKVLEEIFDEQFLNLPLFQPSSTKIFTTFYYLLQSLSSYQSALLHPPAVV